MADDPKPTPPDDEPDPVEAELVAYLDGELDPAAARRIEARIAADPKIRARAESLKRSYDLLDFLPKPEPSPAFASRTLDKLPAVRANPAPLSVTVPSGSVPVPVATASGTGTLALSAAPAAGPTGRPWAWAVTTVVLVAGALGTGYLGTAAARTYLFPPPPPPAEPTADNLPIGDIRVVERLPLYAPVDDVAFVERLAETDRFGDDAGPPPAVTVEPDKPDGTELNVLLKAFRDLPPERQEKIRHLDQQLHALPPDRRDRLFRVLEAYAGWLHRLPDAERKKVLTAPTTEDRLEAIDDAHRTQWVAGLPAKYRQELKAMPPAERGAVIAKWKAEEDAGRAKWSDARFHTQFLLSGKQPWPFTEEGMRKQVLDFARSAYHADDPKKNRLSSPDKTRLAEAVERSEKGGDWVWLGKAVYDFSLAPGARYTTLPEAAPGGRMVTEPADLPPPFQQPAEKRFGNKSETGPVGRWPEFALAVHGFREKPKLLGKERELPALGPCRPAEFRDDVKRFLPALQKKATPAEWQVLHDLEGRWPEYPRELMRLARVHDLSVPGAMPSGPPSQWDQTYSLPNPRPLVRPGGDK
ncbi:hypothetical protein J0H58_07550 [bacterium]|nr:hypothetical protein [bacterium]